MKILLPIAAVGLLVCLSSQADACTCGSVLPCESYAGAQVVFVGRVAKTETVSSSGLMPSRAISTTLTNGTRAAHFKIDEAFLGIDKSEVDIFGEATTCDYFFEEGAQYLVYAYRSADGKTLHTNLCAGTAPLREASVHLAYLRGLKNQRLGSVFSGRVREQYYNFRKQQFDGRPTPRAVVTLESGDRLFRARSNAKGEFALAGLAGGRYKVHTNPVANHSSVNILAELPQTEWDIDIPDHGCLRSWFEIRPQEEISGQLTGKRDNPDRLWVDIRFADRKNTDRNRIGQAQVDAEGRFKSSFLHPGKYVIGFNLESGPSLDYPYPEFYYPGVTNRSRAKVITAGPKRIEGISFPVPERVPERTIEGVAVWPNNKPAANAWIELVNPRTGYRDGNGVQADEQGRFSIPGMEGQTYGVSALVNKGIPLVHSKPLMIKVEQVNKPVRLVIRVP